MSSSCNIRYQSAHDLSIHILSVSIILAVFRLLMLLSCVLLIIMYFHVSMCINACPLLNAFPSFLMPRYEHSCVYTRGVSRSLRLLLSRSTVLLISAILACTWHISRSDSSLRGICSA